MALRPPLRLPLLSLTDLTPHRRQCHLGTRHVPQSQQCGICLPRSGSRTLRWALRCASSTTTTTAAAAVSPTSLRAGGAAASRALSAGWQEAQVLCLSQQHLQRLRMEHWGLHSTLALLQGIQHLRHEEQQQAGQSEAAALLHCALALLRGVLRLQEGG